MPSSLLGMPVEVDGKIGTIVVVHLCGSREPQEVSLHTNLGFIRVELEKCKPLFAPGVARPQAWDLKAAFPNLFRYYGCAEVQIIFAEFLRIYNPGCGSGNEVIHYLHRARANCVDDGRIEAVPKELEDGD